MAKSPRASGKKNAPRGARAGRLLPFGLAIATLGVGVGLAVIPVGNWMDQRDEIDEARQRRAELQAEVEGIEANIEGLLGEEGLEVAARCHAFLVEPGEELYAIPGLDGCVTNPTADQG